MPLEINFYEKKHSVVSRFITDEKLQLIHEKLFNKEEKKDSKTLYKDIIEHIQTKFDFEDIYKNIESFLNQSADSIDIKGALSKFLEITDTVELFLSAFTNDEKKMLNGIARILVFLSYFEKNKIHESCSYIFLLLPSQSLASLVYRLEPGKLFRASKNYIKSLAGTLDGDKAIFLWLLENIQSINHSDFNLKNYFNNLMVIYGVLEKEQKDIFHQNLDSGFRMNNKLIKNMILKGFFTLLLERVGKDKNYSNGSSYIGFAEKVLAAFTDGEKSVYEEEIKLLKEKIEEIKKISILPPESYLKEATQNESGKQETLLPPGSCLANYVVKEVMQSESERQEALSLGLLANYGIRKMTQSESEKQEILSLGLLGNCKNQKEVKNKLKNKKKSQSLLFSKKRPNTEIEEDSSLSNNTKKNKKTKFNEMPELENQEATIKKEMPNQIKQEKSLLRGFCLANSRNRKNSEDEYESESENEENFDLQAKPKST